MTSLWLCAVLAALPGSAAQRELPPLTALIGRVQADPAAASALRMRLDLLLPAALAATPDLAKLGAAPALGDPARLAAALLADPASVARHRAPLAAALGEERLASLERAAGHVAAAAPADKLARLRDELGLAGGSNVVKLDAYFDRGRAQNSPVAPVSAGPGGGKKAVVSLTKDSRALAAWHNRRQERKYGDEMHRPPEADAEALSALRAHAADLVARRDWPAFEAFVLSLDDDRAQRDALAELARDATAERARVVSRLIAGDRLEHGVALAIIAGDVLSKPAWSKRAGPLGEELARRALELTRIDDMMIRAYGFHILEVLAADAAPAARSAKLGALLVDSGKVDRALARHVFEAGFATRHPEWVETVLLRNDAADLDLQFLSWPLWKPDWIAYWERMLAVPRAERARFVAGEPPPYRKGAKAKAPLVSADRLLDLGTAGRFERLEAVSPELGTGLYEARALGSGKRAFVKLVDRDGYKRYLSDAIALTGTVGFGLVKAPREGDAALLEWVPGRALEVEIADPGFWKDPVRWRRLKLLIETLASRGLYVESPVILYPAEGVWKIADFRAVRREVPPREALALYRDALRARLSPRAAEPAMLDAFLQSLGK